MPLIKLTVDCSALVDVPLLGEDGTPMVDAEGNPLTRREPAGPQLIEMTAEEEAAHRANQAALTAQADAITTAREQAAHQRMADLALLAASDDPRHQAMARLLGGG